MKKTKHLVVGVLFAATIFVPVLENSAVSASSLTSETFSGISTVANAWVSGGSGGSVACLTAATSSASNSIPACSGGPFDSVGSGVLRLTPNTGTRSGFAIYNTPVSTSQGLQISFNTYQYGGTGADGISFFLIDGSQSPTQPGASGGSLGYSSGGITPGIVGGYVGVGFDAFGNFSNTGFGTGGVGRIANSITVRGSQASNYQFVTTTPAAGNLEGTTRANSTRQVTITINSDNVMSVAVNYGSGYVNQLSGINLNTINGAGSLPASFKFGFAASTGGSYDTHEISGLNVNTDPPNVSVGVSHSGNFTQGSTGQFTLGVSNDAAAVATQGDTTITDTLPTGLVPLLASGPGWNCNISGQTVTCTNSNTLNPGSNFQNITLNTAVLSNASSPLTNTASVSTINNGNPSPSASDQVTILPGTSDGIPSSTKNNGPNGGDANDDTVQDSQQNNVSSFVDPITNKYAVLDTTASPNCTGNSSVSIDGSNNILHGDGNYTYPAGLMNFTLNCTPGSTATVTMLYYGLTNSSNLVLRKYNASANTYTTISGATFRNVTIGGQQATEVTYQITDNGPLDEDTTSGVIVDPAGPAVLATPATAPNTGSGVAATSFVAPVATTLSIATIGIGLAIRRRRLS